MPGFRNTLIPSRIIIKAMRTKTDREDPSTKGKGPDPSGQTTTTAPAAPSPAATPGIARPPPLSSSSPPSHPHPYPHPKLLLEITDVAHPGAAVWFSAVSDPAALLAWSVDQVLTRLYCIPSSSSSSSFSAHPSFSSSLAHRPRPQPQPQHQPRPIPDPTTTPPPVRSVTVHLCAMGGVADTSGRELDPEQHKRIRLSFSHVVNCAARARDEIAGVLVHELVHCLQHNGRGTCPGGLIEGLADWVRLRAGLAPPHWKAGGGGNEKRKRKRRGGGGGGGGGGGDDDDRWDAGYQHTAWFLDYLERRFGDGTVRRLNEKLRTGEYSEKAFWTELVGRPVEQLWEDYCEEAEGDDEDHGQEI